MLGISFQLAPNLKQELDISCKMSACRNIFPAVEAWLQTTADHQNALQFVARSKKMDRYVCMIDFLVGEVFGDPFRRACFKFYRDEGPALREQITNEIREKMEAVLLFVLIRAYKNFQEKRRMSWRAFVAESKSLFLAA